MSKLSQAAEAKSDQLNAIDLIAGPITVTITNTKIKDDPRADQPVSIWFTGDNGRPWKPSTTMIRILIMKWGDDEAKFIGRHITLFRNPDTTWGGNAVGGVQLSHMSDMKNDDRFLLSTGRGKTQQFKIEHLKMKSPEEIAEEKLNRASTWVSQSKTEIGEFDSVERIEEWQEKNAPTMEALSKYEDLISDLTEFIKVSIADFSDEGKA